MGLRDVNEMAAIGREINGMVETRVSETLVSVAIQAHAMELRLQWIIAAAGHVIEKCPLFFHMHDIADFEGMFGERRKQVAAQVVQIQVFPAGPLGNPDEPFTVVEKAQRRRVGDPTRGPVLTKDDTTL